MRKHKEEAVRPPGYGPALLKGSAWALGVLRQHLVLAVVLVVYVFVVGRCPVYWLTGIPCPGCGMTRAFEALLHLDIAGAFYYHPLFWTVPPAVLYLAHQTAWHLPGGKWARRILLGSLGAAFFLTYLVRLFWMTDSPVFVQFEQSALYRLWKVLFAGR